MRASNQAFCYDEFNRLTWASSQSGSIPCGGTNTAGTLTAAQYSATTYTFDTLDRLTSIPGTTYTYGDSAHLHAVTAIGSSYTASYDAAGNMICRAPTSSTTCSGTPTGAKLTFDNEGRLVAWQNTPGTPTSTVSYLYDGQGNRVARQVTATAQGGSTTTSVVLSTSGQDPLAVYTTTNGTTTSTFYYYAAGQRLAEQSGGVFWYLASDALGSTSVALSGSTPPSQLFAPYGSVRYSSGSMPTSYGFTGQHGDPADGLDYYHARYYDPTAGQFVSADSVLDGLNRYAYVGGNPETYVDPSGHDMWDDSSSGLRQAGIPDATNFIQINASERGGGASLLLGVNPAGVAGAVGGFVGSGTTSYGTGDVLTIQGGNETWAFDGNGGVTISGPHGTEIRQVDPVQDLGLGERDPTLENQRIAADDQRQLDASDDQHGTTPPGGNPPRGTPPGGTPPGGTPPGTQQPTPPAPSAMPSSDPSQPPGPGWQWRGLQPTGSDRGAWYNPVTEETWHPDLAHPDPVRPHWDYREPYRGPFWRWYPDDGSWEPRP